MKFSIETVSKLTGIPAATLRNWEKRYGYPRPERSGGGHRLYTSKDVNFLKMALRLHHEGRNLQELTSIYEDFEDTGEEETRHSPAPESDDVSYRVTLIYESLLKYDVAATSTQWMILNAKLAPRQMFSLVYEVLLIRMGHDWVRSKITIAQEHFVSGFLRMKLGAMMTIDFPATHTPCFAFATLEDERHEGGLMLVGCHLKYRGYGVHYFGIDLPFEALTGALTESNSKVLGISYVGIERLRRDLPKLGSVQIPVVLGGIAILALSDIEQTQIRENFPNISLCFEASSEKAADYMELVGRQHS